MKEGCLIYNSKIDRFVIRTFETHEDIELHCGDCFQLADFDNWKDVSIEKGQIDESDLINHNWYLCNSRNKPLPAFKWEGSKVRI